MGDPEQGDTDKHPKIDVSKALGEAGHEVHDLGYDDVEDTGSVTHPEESEGHALEEIERDLGTHTSG